MSYIELANQTRLAKEKAAQLDDMLASRQADEHTQRGMREGMNQGYALGMDDALLALRQQVDNRIQQQQPMQAGLGQGLAAATYKDYA